MTTAESWLDKTLGYRFHDPALLERALTHRSAGGRHNERLEFLGDAILGMVIAEQLYRDCPSANEGDLSRLRSHLVRRETLGQIGADIGLGNWLRLGQGEMKSGGFRRRSTLANGLEAVLGAVYLDGGLPSVVAIIERLFADRLRDLPDTQALKDAKTRLQEYLQGRGLDLPVYAVESATGEDHRREFSVTCTIDALNRRTRACGRSRRQAEQRAAESMLAELADG